MIAAVLSLIVPAALVSGVATYIALRVGLAARAFDTAPRAGQAKAPSRRVPNTGGVGVFAGIALPPAAGLAAAWLTPKGFIPALSAHADGLRARTGEALTLLVVAAALHAMGLIDDRRPLGPLVKLCVMTALALAVVLGTGTRLLTAADGLAGGAWLSVILSVAWIVLVTNAMNFMDNMDGLAAGVSAVAAGCLLAAALLARQWFVGAAAACAVGSCAGFLFWNRPPARIFMGDGGSLVLGFTLAVLAARTTYTGQTPEGSPMSAAWYGVFTPLLVLAVPLYDLVSVCVLRVRQGRSPMLGDLQHASHRLVKRGFTRGRSVLILWALTAITGAGGVVLGHAPAWAAALLGAQTLLLLAVLAALELGTSPPGARWDSLEVGGER